MRKEGWARAWPSDVWVLLAVSSGPGQGEAAAGTVEHFQAHGCTFPSLGLPQEGCGCRGRAAGGWESPGRWFLLSGGQRFPLLCGTSPSPCHLEGLTQGHSLGLSKRGWPLVLCPGADGASPL